MPFSITKLWLDTTVPQFQSSAPAQVNNWTGPADGTSISAVNAGHKAYEWTFPQFKLVYPCINATNLEFWDFEQFANDGSVNPVNNVVVMEVSNSNWNNDQTQMVWDAIALTKSIYKRIVGFHAGNGAGYKEFQYKGVRVGATKWVRLTISPTISEAKLNPNYLLLAEHVTRDPNAQVTAGRFDAHNQIKLDGFGSVTSGFTGEDNFDWNSGALIIDNKSIGEISLKGVTVTLAEMRPEVNDGTNYIDKLLCRLTVFRNFRQDINGLFDPVFGQGYAPFATFGDWRDSAIQQLIDYTREDKLFDAFIRSPGTYDFEFPQCESLNANDRITVVLSPMYDVARGTDFGAYVGAGGAYMTKTLIARACINYKPLSAGLSL